MMVNTKHLPLVQINLAISLLFPCFRIYTTHPTEGESYKHFHISFLHDSFCPVLIGAQI